MKVYKFTNAAATWWAEYWVDGMKDSTAEKIMSIQSKNASGVMNNTDLWPEMIALGLPNKVGADVTQVVLTALAVSLNLSLVMTYEQEAGVTKATPLNVAAAPSAIVLAVGSAQPVGGVTNVAIPADGATDNTGAVTGWAAATADKIKITVTNAASTSNAIKINGATYSSGTDFTILPGVNYLDVLIVTNRSGYYPSVRKFIIPVTPA